MLLGYADLSLRPSDEDVAIEMIRLARRLGYRILAVEYRDNIDMGKLSNVASSMGVKVVGRVTIRGSSRSEVRRALDSIRGIAVGETIVSVEAEALDAARYAGVNKRVHMLRVKPGMESVVDKSQVRLFESRSWGAFEVSLAYVLKPKGWSYISEVMRRISKLNVSTRLVVVSDANDIYTMWSPASIIGLLSSLGLSPEHAARCISSTPATIASQAIKTQSRI